MTTIYNTETGEYRQMKPGEMLPPIWIINPIPPAGFESQPDAWVWDTDHLRARTPAEEQAVAWEHAWTELRSERNARLAACDWTQLPDTPLAPVDVENWRVYRQALRELPQSSADPTHVVWPTPPATSGTL